MKKFAVLATLIVVFSLASNARAFRLSEGLQQSILGETFYLLTGAGCGSFEGPHATTWAMICGGGAFASVEILGYFSGQKSSILEVADSAGLGALAGKLAEDFGPIGGALEFGAWGLFDEGVWEKAQLEGAEGAKKK